MAQWEAGWTDQPASSSPDAPPSPPNAPAHSGPTPSLRFDLLRTTLRLIGAHWWKLVAIAACAYVAHHYLMEAAVRAGQLGAVPGLLVFSFVPLVLLVAVVVSLLTLRRPHGEGLSAGAAVAALGSVLVPFLVVYESQGTLRDDTSDYFYAGFWADYGEVDTLARIPEPTSPIVLAVVAAAFLVRALGSRLAGSTALRGSPVGRRARLVLQLLVGYCEAVWIVLGVVVMNYAIQGLQAWWMERRIGRGLGEWWDSVTISLPEIGAIGDRLVVVIGTILDGMVVGLATPLAWLTIGVVVYGITAADQISEASVIESVKGRERLGAVTRRIDPAVIGLAWRRIADTEGRFGALLGGLSLILRAGFTPVLVFCLLYTLLSAGLPYLIWAVARLVAPNLDYMEWTAVHGPITALIYIATMVLTTPLLAVYGDALLTRFGAASQLRLPGQGTSSSM